jgi:phage FluMu protein Com
MTEFKETLTCPSCKAVFESSKTLLKDPSKELTCPKCKQVAHLEAFRAETRVLEKSIKKRSSETQSSSANPWMFDTISVFVALPAMVLSVLAFALIASSGGGVRIASLPDVVNSIHTTNALIALYMATQTFRWGFHKFFDDSKRD